MHAFWWIFWVVMVMMMLFWAWPNVREAGYDDSALDELRRRYAAGEIEDDEFHHRLEVLSSNTKRSTWGTKGKRRSNVHVESNAETQVR
jgi:putative membrane protein